MLRKCRNVREVEQNAEQERKGDKQILWKLDNRGTVLVPILLQILVICSHAVVAWHAEMSLYQKERQGRKEKYAVLNLKKWAKCMKICCSQQANSQQADQLLLSLDLR